MKVITLKKLSQVYTGNAYLVLGEWNRISDINSLVDVGTDETIVDELRGIYTGVGKRPVECVVLTHGHFDHIGGLHAVKAEYGPKVYAHGELEGIDARLRDGQTIRLGDRDFRVIHTPGHSHDSICLYCEQERVLFSGDTQLEVRTPGGTYSSEYVNVLQYIAGLEIDVIYPGHGRPVTVSVRDVINATLDNISRSLDLMDSSYRS